MIELIRILNESYTNWISDYGTLHLPRVYSGVYIIFVNIVSYFDKVVSFNPFAAFDKV